MNEIDLLTRMREEVPAEAVPPRAEQMFLAGLRNPAGSSSTRRTRPGLAVRTRPRWRLVLAGGLALALAAGAAVIVAAQNPATRSGPQPVLTVRLLSADAARAAAAGPRISPHQWVYNRDLDETGHYKDGYTCWNTADATEWASYSHGKLVHNLPCVPLPEPAMAGNPGHLAVAYRDLSSLPRNPAALDRYLARLIGPLPRARYGYDVFLQISGMLLLYLMPPSVTAEMYRAIALLPGMRVIKNATDLAGQHGIGLAQYTRPLTTEIILNPHTYRLIGLTFSANGNSDGVSYLARALVSGPGVRP